MNSNKNRILSKAQSLEELLATCPENQIIGDNLVKAWTKINSPIYKKIICSISGGSDSDVMLDICWRCDKNNKIIYVWFDTGLEYQATKDHLKYLENKYNIRIIRYKSVKPIPICCNTYGQPFLSKQVSEYIQRLQKHGFKWENESFEDLLKKYPRCKVALKWWCNSWGEKSRFNIEYNMWLKEFMILNPPKFLISNNCCHYAKKLVAKHVIKDLDCDLNIVGVRKAEGGARSTAYKSCFNSNYDKSDEYRPLFWYKDLDKNDYKIAYCIENSKCYTNYGSKRTGCAGCPFGRDFEKELEIIERYEPKLFKAVNNIFGDSYEYTRQYKEFRKQKTQKRS